LFSSCHKDSENVCRNNNKVQTNASKQLMSIQIKGKYGQHHKVFTALQKKKLHPEEK